MKDLEKCIKNGCDRPRAIGFNLCKEHSAEWNKIWEISGNTDWEKYIKTDSSLKEKVKFD
jgi:hypothetical protein